MDDEELSFGNDSDRKIQKSNNTRPASNYGGYNNNFQKSYGSKKDDDVLDYSNSDSSGVNQMKSKTNNQVGPNPDLMFSSDDDT